MRLVAICLLCACLAVPAVAQDCAPDGPETHKVAAVIDGETIALADGRQVRLVTYLSPRRPLWLDADKPWRAAERALAELTELAQGRDVALTLADPAHDRHGRVMAQVTVIGGRERQWLQGTLIARGHGRVYSLGPGAPCFAAALAREAEAREAGRGLWRDPFYAVRPAVPGEDLRKLNNAFAIVSGKVLKVASVGNRTFLNFEADWRKDFTVIVSASAARLFAKAGKDLAGLEGTEIRVRGWIQSFNGPMIEASHPEQVERLNE